MPFRTNRQTLLSKIVRRASEILPFMSLLIVGAGASLLCLSNGARAADKLVVQFKDAEITITTREIADFARTGSLPERLQEFLNTHSQVPEDIRRVLTDRIKISRKFVEKNIDSSIGQFALLKIDELIQNSSVREDLESLEAAILKEVDKTGGISLLGLIEAYPVPAIRLNLTGLENAYEDVRHFLEDIEPALAVAKSFLQDIVCDCETQTANVSGSRDEAEIKNESVQTAQPIASCDRTSKAVATQDAPQTLGIVAEHSAHQPDKPAIEGTVVMEEFLAGEDFLSTESFELLSRENVTSGTLSLSSQ